MEHEAASPDIEGGETQFLLDLNQEEDNVLQMEQEVLSPCPAHSTPAAARVDQESSFLSLCRRAAAKLEVQWPYPTPAQKPLKFAGFYLPSEPADVKHRLPMFKDFVSELTSSWSKALSIPPSCPDRVSTWTWKGQTKQAWWASLRWEPSLAAYLAPSHNQGVSGPTLLPSKPCRFSSAQLEKIYKAQGNTARALSSVTMLQTYQAMALAELAAQMPQENPLLPLLNKIRLASDHNLRVSCCVALALGKGMASTVVAQRHLWLTLADVPDKDRVAYLEEPVTPTGLFGQALDVIQTKCEQRKKQAEAIRCIIPRRDARPKAPSSFGSASHPPPFKKAATPGTSKAQPAETSSKPQPCRQSAWSKGPPPSQQDSSAARKKKSKSS
ncbi:uncharacterized protein LOC106531896 [Austrofundulus limnaeus]|uniref:Uncharacterized protein LOC106531896 n=1 Tax=Austrofundulus limnaeus TaxID=52670 RepID=A0A2I4CTH9_AUSLI|nr:PREDICTED: uncharacterized protein LOC106531896 [Austrofundulus limnaeus]